MKLRSIAEKKETDIKVLLVIVALGLFSDCFLKGMMTELAENSELVYYSFGIGSLVIVMALIGIILSYQYIKLADRMKMRATAVPIPPKGPTGTEPIPPPYIYEYRDEDTYKWICGFCGGENATDEERCLICGYLRRNQ